ncbi:immunoglobulin-like domain-containing protein [Costertonia aggregata]|uniref:DUF5011 domain-containing protein n=1 Tax=Costertonia aggregata TaxID=343403 RepID=A0A7H9ARZ0_9FLAO|nr:immunoglobulin-like domain-containing protein [Costertonia aggregata]QLG46214.1 DUF5011 domain-containing protein [Costertonia aggregata]
MEHLIKKAKLIAILICAISFHGCEDDDVILPKVIADFTFTLNEDTGTVTFLNTSEDASKYVWDFGDGTTSSEINPIKTFNVSGTYTITLEAFNVSGASQTFEDEIVILIKEKIALPITFDSPTVDYSATVFSGASFNIVMNPDVSGSNDTASNVGEITNNGNAFEGFFFNLGLPVDFTVNKTIQMNFWSETTVDLLLKLEDGTAADIEVTASHGGTGWESVTFDFSSDASYSTFTFFVDGPGRSTGTFYIDDIQQIVTPTAESGCADTPIGATSLPLDFESCDTFPVSDNFGSGITSELAQNPDKIGINTSDFVLRVDKPAGSDFFAGIQNTFADNFDLTTTNTFKVKVYSTKSNVVFRFELALNPQTDPVTGNPAPVFATIPNANEWTELEVMFTGLPGGPMAYNQLVIKPDNGTDTPITEDGTYYIDDIRLETPGGSTGFDGGLITNGDFENGGDSWTGNALNVQSEGGNGFNFANVETAVPAEPFQVNLSQVLEIVQGTNYILTFDASSDRARTLIAGIGLNESPFTNTAPEVNLTTDTQTFTLQLAANDFGNVNSRVLFDMAGAVGTVVIDNVSLVEGGDGSDTNGNSVDTENPIITLNGDATVNLTVGDAFTDAGATATDNVDGDISGDIIVAGDIVDINTAGTYVITYNVSDAAGNAAAEVTRTVIVEEDTNGVFDDGLLTNGDFENGGASWIGNALNVITDGGNSFNLANVTTAIPSEPFQVNLSQVVEIVQGSNYILSFEASSDRARTILAGIGLNAAPFTNTNQSVNLTTDTQTFTLQLSASDFGGVNSRVLFDMAAEVGTVVIDNVSLVLDGGSSGGSGGCTGTLVAATTLPVDFEGCETFLASQNFGAGLTSELVANPFKTGINTSDFVLQVNKPSGSDFFAGIQNTFPTNFDLTTTDTFKVKIYSTKANVVFRFELALNPQTDPVTGNPAPVFVTIPNANEWTEVEVTFTGLPGGPTAYNQFVIKPDNAVGDPAITVDGTYYIDDIVLE